MAEASKSTGRWLILIYLAGVVVVSWVLLKVIIWMDGAR